MNSAITGLIVEDEPALALWLQNKLASLWPELNVIGISEDGPAAKISIKNHKPNVVFLDVRLPGCLGLEVASEISDSCHIVFVTAYDEYAIQAFENNAIDYLLKPVQEDRLKASIARLKSRLESRPANLEKILEPYIADYREKVLKAEQQVVMLSSQINDLKSVALYDELTGVLNRRGLNQACDRELKRASRSKLPLCLTLIDIDHFKQFNDAYGHDIGDRALIHLANSAKAVFRPTDIIARYGGEEFVVVLPQTSIAEGVSALERLLSQLRTHPFSSKSENLIITFSAGIIERKEDEPLESLLKRSDIAMYQAKIAGRNRIVSC